MPLLNPPRDKQPYGYMDPALWTEFSGWMHDNELIEGLPPSSELLSNSYLPGAIPE